MLDVVDSMLRLLGVVAVIAAICYVVTSVVRLFERVRALEISRDHDRVMRDGDYTNVNRRINDARDQIYKLHNRIDELHEFMDDDSDDDGET